MSKLMKHKGFYGSYEFDFEDEVLHGKIECINDLVTYEASDVAGLKAAFEEAVEDYLETCEMLGKKPDKPMNGSFNVRIGEELHKKAYLKSLEENCSINDIVKRSVNYYLNDSKMIINNHSYHYTNEPVKKTEHKYEMDFSFKNKESDYKMKAH